MTVHWDQSTCQVSALPVYFLRAALRRAAPGAPRRQPPRRGQAASGPDCVRLSSRKRPRVRSRHLHRFSPSFRLRTRLSVASGSRRGRPRWRSCAARPCASSPATPARPSRGRQSSTTIAVDRIGRPADLCPLPLVCPALCTVLPMNVLMASHGRPWNVHGTRAARRLPCRLPA